MKDLKVILFKGFLVWVIPFVVAFGIFPLRATSRPLFESIMPVVLVITVVVIFRWYLTRIGKAGTNLALQIGCIWLAMSIILDSFFFLFGPFKIGIMEYASDIGFTYLVIPIITTGVSWSKVVKG